MGKVEDLCPTSHNMSEPIVTKTEYSVMDVPGDGSISLLTADGNPKDDLNLPTGTDDLDKVAKQILDDFAAGHEVTVITISAIGQKKFHKLRHVLPPWQVVITEKMAFWLCRIARVKIGCLVRESRLKSP